MGTSVVVGKCDTCGKLVYYGDLFRRVSSSVEWSTDAKERALSAVVEKAKVEDGCDCAGVAIAFFPGGRIW